MTRGGSYGHVCNVLKWLKDNRGKWDKGKYTMPLDVFKALVTAGYYAKNTKKGDCFDSMRNFIETVNYLEGKKND